ncbi:unnamed protein product [Rotaria sp. Silwood2]|nr:unnamed protein product [Rotaria sp. Silwood2]CAF2917983.1 unnamed protein product [Rotaria sp. Silwood2]CAF3184232.1 unnamed protein product [Rotaria sp. Silwood2]CAF3332579.1 unnamed protein product [Rotaria sp. Silwood2]CAF4040451.1 unnamed protein product [Rotaria sp. Silwood2]
MASSSFKRKNKDDGTDRLYSSEPKVRRAGANPTPCKYDRDYRRKGCTFTHSEASKGATAATKSDCKYDMNCTLLDCHFNHPNGGSIDHKMTFSSESTEKNTASSQGTSSPSHLEYRNHQYQCSLASYNSSPSSSFGHPTDEDINQVPINNDTKTTNSTTDAKQQQQLDTELIEIIDEFLSKAKENLHEFDINDEQVFETLQQNALIESRLQRNEFQSVISCLSMKYNEILSLLRDNSDKMLQLQRIKQKLERELKRWQSHLPVYARRSDIIEKLKINQVLILKADTGSGKSTQIVQYLCDANFADEKQIICTQPRKLATLSLAARVAEEYGWKIGEEIGFQVAGDQRTTSNGTKIKFVTDVLFLNEYQNSPTLEQYSVVIVDEAHERKIDTDIVLGLMKRCLRKRKDLKLIVMSATLDTCLIYDYFSSNFTCETLEVAGRTYPIEDYYLDDDENYVQAAVTKAIEIHQSYDIGDILVFLAGQDEIDLALIDLKKKLEYDRSYIGLPLHGKLSEKEFARIFEKMPDKRKIIFSTNVAETSVAVDGIKHVVESGMVKEKMWDEKRKIPVVKIGQITKTSVKQRRRIAGRTSAGKCYHLYTVETYESMDECSRTEILFAQPTMAILKLKNLNIDRIESFEWLQSPPISNLQEANQLLIWLNAVDSKGKLTQLGRNMARLDIDPKLTAMLFKGQELDCLWYALVLAGMLTVSRNIWWISEDQESRGMISRARAEFSHESGDHITLISIYLKWSVYCAKNTNKRQQYEWCKNNSINGKSLQMAHEFITEKAKQMDYEIEILDSEDLNDNVINRLLKCIAAGHFMNLAVSNGPLRPGYQVISACSQTTNESVIARTFHTSTLSLNDQIPKYVLFNELLSRHGTNYLTVLSSIDLNCLKSVSEDWYKAVNGTNLHTISYECFTFKNVGAALLRAIDGRHACHLNKLEDITQAIVDINYKKSKLTICSRPANLNKAKIIVQEIIQKEKQKLLLETEEMKIVGRTRILMGAGGVSQMILFAGEYVRIIIAKLPSTITEERIQTLCEPFGETSELRTFFARTQIILVRKIDFIRQGEHNSCVAVTYAKVEQARSAFCELNGYIEQGREIVVTDSCVKNEATIDSQNCRLKAIWYLTQSTGNGRIIFEKEKSARDAYELFKRLRYQCRYEHLTNLPRLKVTYYLLKSNQKAFVNFQSFEDALNVRCRIHPPETFKIVQNRQNHGISLLLEGFSKDDDEEDIRSRFQDCTGFVGVQVLRGRKGQIFVRPASAEDDIKAMFNPYKSFQRDTISINPKIWNGKVEAFVEFLESTELKQAVEEMNGKKGIIGRGKVRLSEPGQKRNDEVKTKKEDEYILHFQHLDLSFDKYDLIKILKENQLYDDVKNVIVYRQKFKNENSATAVTNKVDSDVEVALVNLRSMFLSTAGLFRSIPDYRISSCAPDGTVTALILFNDPMDITTAIQTYDNQVIQLLKDSSKLRLLPPIAHQIFINAALRKAIPNKIQEAIQYVREKCKRIHVKVASLGKEDKTAAMKICIEGDDIQQITMAKIAFDTLMKGMEYRYKVDTEKTRLIFDRGSTTALQKIQDETGTYIWFSYSNSFVRIYGDNQAPDIAAKSLDEYIENVLNNRNFTITLDIPKGYLRQVLKLGTTYQDTIGKEFHVKIIISDVKRQILIIGKQQDITKAEEAIKKNWSDTLAEQQLLPKENATTTSNECPICCEVANYILEMCGHVSCLNCLKQELSRKFDTTLSNESLKIKCIMQECNSVLSLRDIKTIIDSQNMSRVARASFQAFLKTDNDIVQCIGIDCQQVR